MRFYSCWKCLDQVVKMLSNIRMTTGSPSSKWRLFTQKDYILIWKEQPEGKYHRRANNVKCDTSDLTINIQAFACVSHSPLNKILCYVILKTYLEGSFPILISDDFNCHNLLWGSSKSRNTIRQILEEIFFYG